MAQYAGFRCDGREYAAQAVVSAAAFRSEMTAVWMAVRDGLAATAYANENGYALDEDALQAASEEYRQERGLASAEATEHWFAARGVSLDDFENFLERRLWLSRFGQEIASIREDYADPPEALAPLIWPEMILCGAFDDFALWLARRVALEAGSDGAPPSPEEDQEERGRFFKRADIAAGQCGGWCEEHQCSAQWLDELLRLEVLYRRKRRELLTPESFDREMRMRRLELVGIEVEAAGFPSEAMAQEAYACVVVDGAALPDVSAQAHGTSYHATVFLEGLPEELQTRFLSAAPGETFPPVEDGGVYWVYRVCRKIEPDTANGEVHRRLEHALITRYFDELVDTQIDWLPWADGAA